jgi:predicted DsbA family dithiol-disulfide isomerase
MKKQLFAVLAVMAVSVSLTGYAKTVQKNEKISITVITDMKCDFCSTEEVQKRLAGYFPKAAFALVDYRAKPAQGLIAKYDVKTLPCFLIPSEVKDSDGFKNISESLIKKGDKFILKQDMAGMFLFLGRHYVGNEVTYFFDLYDYRTKDTFPILREFCKEKNIKLNINIIVPSVPVFGYPQQEVTTALAVQKAYPDKFFDYLSERIKTIETLDCTTVAAKMSLDINVLNKALEPAEAGKLLNENEALAKELGITNGNALLANNVRLFMIMKANKEDIAKVVNSK